MLPDIEGWSQEETRLKESPGIDGVWAPSLIWEPNHSTDCRHAVGSSVGKSEVSGCEAWEPITPVPKKRIIPIVESILLRWSFASELRQNYGGRKQQRLKVQVIPWPD